MEHWGLGEDPMIRSFAVTLFSLFVAVATCQAATLTCGTTPLSPSYLGTCTAPLGSFPPQISTESDSPTFSQQDWNDKVTVEFTNGPTGLASGYFVPCFYLFSQPAGPTGSAEASAVLGNVSVTKSSYGLLNSCSGSSADFAPNTAIPFTFGTTQSYALSLSVEAYGGRHGAGDAWASFIGFEVFDSSGNLIPATLTETLASPEPKPLWLMVAAGLFSGGMMFTRRIVAKASTQE